MAETTRSVPTWPLYIGGFIGPFGGQIVGTMLPELSRDLAVSLQAVSLALTAYLVPFAALMLVSGTIAERIGRRRAVRIAYLVYIVASLACAFAPTFPLFIAGRVLQGVANAFTTPVLVGALSDAVPPDRLGRSLGMYGSMQALGQALAPLAGGLAAALNWRAGFVVVAVVAGALFFLPPQDAPRHPTEARGRFRSLANRQLALACAVAGLAYLTTTGVILLVALFGRVEFGLSPGLAGLAVAAFGVAGLLTGRRTGSLLDRLGLLPVGMVAHALLGLSALIIGLTSGLPVGLGVTIMVSAVALGGMSGTATRSVAQNLAVTSAPTNRSGASSVMLACQFGGSALAPLLWVPLFTGWSAAGAIMLTGVPAVLSGLVLAAVWLSRERPPRAT
ncbi:MAG: MFS transporter [Propionibacteriaceae bacterium]|nr:MFS transporter [Propionibacteriaceae bacterium]